MSEVEVCPEPQVASIQMTAECAAAAAWLHRFERFAREGISPETLFRDESYWRDALAFTWDIRTFSGKASICEALAARRIDADASGFKVAQDPPPQLKARAGIPVVEAFFDFRTKGGRGRGIVRLMQEGPGQPFAKAWTFLTTLQELDGSEERTGPRQPREGEYARSFGRPNWRDRRNVARLYTDRDPEVLVIGGGQAGITLAARLGQMGVDTLVVDRHARVGDNWRKRYDALTLHNESWVCDLPYMPFPPTWPVYLPKDMVADWFETYAWAMELNYWTGTELAGAEFDPVKHRWTVRLRRTDGGDRVLQPAHLVLATGVSGGPKLPNLPGLEDFAGQVMHSHEYRDGSRWKGQRALIVGTGNSAHDIAQDLQGHGASVTMVQRSPTTIVSVEPAAQLVFALYSEGPSREDCDLLSVSMPYALMVAGQKLLTQQMVELDRELLANLERAGFRTDLGPDDSGYYMKYLRTGGGYYLNVGCSELIASGAIDVIQNAEIERFEREGTRFKDGALLPADLIVLATGYENMQESIRRLLGGAIADKVGPVWGFDENGDMRNVWKQTAQENLWLMAGSFAQCRTYSRYVALQIQAIRTGLIRHRAAISG